MNRRIWLVILKLLSYGNCKIIIVCTKLDCGLKFQYISYLYYIILQSYTESICCYLWRVHNSIVYAHQYNYILRIYIYSCPLFLRIYIYNCPLFPSRRLHHSTNCQREMSRRWSLMLILKLNLRYIKGMAQ